MACSLARVQLLLAILLLLEHSNAISLLDSGPNGSGTIAALVRNVLHLVS
jgi:hypothetical protein